VLSADPPDAAVVGGGPAGLMAAEILAANGVTVTIFDQMPSVGRKLLMAGRGGLNLTHSEPLPALLARYGRARVWLEAAIVDFPPTALIAWSHELGQPTFVGSSGRVFPRSMKASPLLRAWLARLDRLGVQRRPRHRWTGWSPDGAVCFATPGGAEVIRPGVTILAVGGASWPRLGTDGHWAGYLADVTAPFLPANCGFEVDWSTHLRQRFAGHALKRIALTFRGQTIRGEAMLTETGIEGGAVYALSAPLRDAIAANGPTTVNLDLRPDLDQPALAARLAAPRRGQSLSGFLRRQAGLGHEAVALVQEALHAGANPGDMVVLIKALPVTLRAARPIDRAISSAGGLRREALDPHFMLRDRPGTFAAGEMLDWEAPTGGYLLQACFSTGVAAAKGALAWMGRR
jgi:hypothetical protein